MGFFQFEIIIDVLDSSFRFIQITVPNGSTAIINILLFQFGDRLCMSDSDV